MLSFIIIGKNEGWKLKKSIESVLLSIELNKIKNSEVIYVDSNSNDGSIQLAKKYNIKVVLIEGKSNAAVARNIGYNESSKKNLIFIDGDMEINSNFLPLILDSNFNLKFSFCSGNWINYNYDNFENRILLGKELKKKMTFNETEFVTGGLFAIKASVWNSVGGMNTKMKRSQDWDLALRLAKKKFFLYRLKDVFAKHHTLSQKHSIKKMWSMFFSGYKLYRLVILRSNFFNYYQWKHFLRINYTFILFLFFLIVSLSIGMYELLYLYLFSVFIRNLFTFKNKIKFVLNGFIIAILYDLLFLFAIFFFHPRKIEPSYKVLKFQKNH